MITHLHIEGPAPAQSLTTLSTRLGVRRVRLAGMDDELPRVHLADCPEDIQRLARDIVALFRIDATWPTVNDVHVMRVERDIDEAPFARV